MQRLQSSLPVAILTVMLGSVLGIHSQVLTCAEVQGEAESSPYAGEQVTVSGKVTVYFGDVWYIQDDYGPWNGLLCVGPNVLIDANPPWWDAPRQPEVGDVLALTGTIVEVDGNTQMMDITDFVFEDFWNATPLGLEVTVEEMMDESLEGTRARLGPVTVMTAPEGDVWSVSDATGTLTIVGVDVDDVVGDEDADGPTPGDVYRVYGAVRQIGDAYVLDLNDIDTLSLVTNVEESLGSDPLKVHPNPTTGSLRVSGLEGSFEWELLDINGRRVQQGRAAGTSRIQLNAAPNGTYIFCARQAGSVARQAVVLDRANRP